MPRKTLIAVLVALVGAVAAAPASAACVPPYCPSTASIVRVSLSSNTKPVIQNLVQKQTKTIETEVGCFLPGGCKGRIVLTSLNAQLARAHISKVTVYGSVSYSLKDGETAKIKIPLNAAGRRALEQTGTLNTAVVAVSKGVRTVVAKVKVKSTAKHKKKKSKKKKSKHFTRARVKPGFTG